jgi:hypothetical protein
MPKTLSKNMGGARVYEHDCCPCSCNLHRCSPYAAEHGQIGRVAERAASPSGRSARGMTRQRQQLAGGDPLAGPRRWSPTVSGGDRGGHDGVLSPYGHRWRRHGERERKEAGILGSACVASAGRTGQQLAGAPCKLRRRLSVLECDQAVAKLGDKTHRETTEFDSRSHVFH